VITRVGWQVILCDLIWQVTSDQIEAIQKRALNIIYIGLLRHALCQYFVPPWPHEAHRMQRKTGSQVF